MNVHPLYIHRCIELAQLGAGNVAPNPMVGAVLVYGDTIIGEGYHQQYGQAHAEVICINSVTESNRHLIAYGTLYVSLEPCAHYGKTPPCADLVIRSGIRKVVIGCRDPFELVDGKGVEKLIAANIDVVIGVLEKECIALNKRFFTFHQQKRPYVTLKWAESSNKIIGRLDGEQVNISNYISDRLVHKWRSEEAGILIGTNTALNDDPQLTNRLWIGKSPVRLVVDLNLRLPNNLKIFDGSQPTIIFNYEQQKQNGLTSYQKLLTSEPVCKQILSACYSLHITSVLIEGGAQTLQTFINEGLWDDARVICNNDLILDGGVASPILKGYTLVKKEHYLNDTISYFEPADAAL